MNAPRDVLDLKRELLGLPRTPTFDEIEALGLLSPAERMMVMRGLSGAAGVANPFFVEVTSAGVTTSITAYTSGDQVGTEVTCALSPSNNVHAVVAALTLVDYAKIVGAMELRFFRDTTTPAADNAAASWSDADEDKIVGGGVVQVPAPLTDGLNGVSAVPNLWFQGRTGTGHPNFYLDIITRSGHTFFGAASDLRIKLSGFYFS